LLITSIIFSKDRPLQLDLCLGSIKKNFSDSTQNIVIYNYSDTFSAANSALTSEHRDVEWWPQGSSLLRDVYAAIAGAKHEYICFFTDDDICFSEIPSIPYETIFAEPYISCMSLRLGLNICKRFHEGDMFPDQIGEHYVNGDFISWPRTSYLYGSYWSYSLSVDGHIFRKDELLNMIDELCYLELRYKWGHTPNALEAALQRFWTTSPNFMIAPRNSVMVNSPNNRVQDTCDNMSGEIHSYDADFLLGKYMAGSRINLDYLNFSNIQCPHTEIDILQGI